MGGSLLLEAVHTNGCGASTCTIKRMDLQWKNLNLTINDAVSDPLTVVQVDFNRRGVARCDGLDAHLRQFREIKHSSSYLSKCRVSFCLCLH